MIEIKAIFEDGDHILTKINTTIEGAKDYYLNKYFNFGISEDNMKKCINVVEL